MNLPSLLYRPIRSFVRREGRMTPAQKRALAELFPRYGLAVGKGPIDFLDAFGRHAPVMLEIGFGNGDTLAALAAQHPENNYLGIEVHRPGVGRLLARLETEGLNNVRVLCADAKEILAQHVPDESLSAVYVLFPDPWPKRRHRKRRLVQTDFAHLVGVKLRPGGYFHLATDWSDYAEHMLKVFSAVSVFENVAGSGHYAEPADLRPLTKFEKRGRARGLEVRDLIFRRAGGG